MVRGVKAQENQGLWVLSPTWIPKKGATWNNMEQGNHPRIQKRQDQIWMLICIHMPWQTSVLISPLLRKSLVQSKHPDMLHLPSKPENAKLPAPYVLHSNWHGEGTGPMLGTSVRSDPGAAGGKSSRSWSLKSIHGLTNPIDAGKGILRKVILDTMIALDRLRTPSLSIHHLRKIWPWVQSSPAFCENLSFAKRCCKGNILRIVKIGGPSTIEATCDYICIPPSCAW